MSDSFTIALVQMQCDPDPARNLSKAERRIVEAAQQGAQIICLPELFQSLYFCQRIDIRQFDLAEPIPGPTTDRLAQLASRHGIVIVASLFERRAAGLYHNTVAVLDADGSLAGIYRKMHIPDDPLYYEKYYFTPGDLGFKCFHTRHGRIGTLICWDQWFPEAARLTALRGAEILVYPTAIGWHPAEKAEHGEPQYSAWQTIQRGHAIANGVYVAAVNRVGHEGSTDGGLEFWGGSFVADPLGVVLQKASHDTEQLVLVSCDRNRIEDVRRNWPFLRDRRIDAFSDITRRAIEN
jgi:N-carbamoylputrescine amidase